MFPATRRITNKEEKTMKRKLIVISLAVMMVLMAACAAPAATEQPTAPAPAAEATAAPAPAAEPTAAPAAKPEDIHIGIVVKSMADQHWALVKAGAESKAAELGVKVDCIGPNSESDVQAQVDMIDNMIGQGVNALCVAPSSQDAVLTPLKTADEAGIPIITIDTDTTFEKRLSFIGTGNYAAAYAGGEAAAAVVGKGATCVIIRGRLGDTTHDDREQGYLDALQANGVEVLEIKVGDSDAEKSMNVTQDILQVYDKIDLICCTTDNQCLGVQRAIEAAGVNTKIMSFDGTSAVCDLIIQGKVLGSVAQNPFAMGELAVENAIKAIHGEKIEARIDSGSKVIMADNAAAYLADLQKLTK
jgi:ribose transport system substrate-binding protein